LRGIERGISGVLTKDEKGVVWVCHRGIINRVSRAVFLSAYKGTKAWVWGEDEVAVIGAISNPDFLAQVSIFVKFVNRLRAKRGGVASGP
jgi:hypothetical protein